MICRQCGIRIPERYLGLDSFRCPNCGKSYYKRTSRPPEDPRPAYRQPARPAYQQPARPAYRQPVQRPRGGGAGGFREFFAARSPLLLIALVIGAIYIIAQFAHMSGASNYVSSVDPQTADELGQALGTAIGVGLLMPHAILTALAVIFNTVAWFASKRWAALTAAILYAVGGVLGFVNFLFVLVPMILCFVAASKLKAIR